MLLELNNGISTSKIIVTDRIPLFIGIGPLIHMNGRVYDYNLGRFLSVDLFIQDPGNSQSMNPYSYIMNNPLSGTDPSGYAAKCESVAAATCDSNIQKSNGAVAVQTVSGSIADVNQEVSQLESQGYILESGQSNVDGSANAVLTKPSMIMITGGTNLGAGGSLLDQSISEEQLELAKSGKIIEFWKSRWENNKDPVARTALIGWKKGDLVGAAVSEQFAANHAWSDLEGYIKDINLNVSMEEIGAELALAHARTVIGDTHGVKGLLSPQQVAQYHHQVFDKNNIPAGFFGGTHRVGGHWYLPDVEVPSLNGWSHMIMSPESYSDEWCNGCDSTPRSDGR